MSIVILFNGQGAHYQGMGLDFARDCERSQQVFDLAESVSGYPLRRWIDQDAPELAVSAYAQVAVAAVSLAIWEAVKDQLTGREALAGLSLGEYSALMASGGLSNEDGFRLLTQRGQLMSNHCQHLPYPAEMLAVIGAPLVDIQDQVAIMQADGAAIWVANMNSHQQTVLAGRAEDLAVFHEWARAAGYKRCLPLKKVEGPFHTPLMAGVQAPLAEVLETVHFQAGVERVTSNTTVTPHQVDQVAQRLVRHLVEPVAWRQTIDQYINAGARTFLQIGPGNTLAKLIQRDKLPVEVRCLDAVTDLASVVAWIQEEKELCH